jgi:hypothetical protein
MYGFCEAVNCHLYKKLGLCDEKNSPSVTVTLFIKKTYYLCHWFANRYEGPVKREAEVREFWRAEPSKLLPATQAAPLPTYNLAEFSLWQTSSQNRFLVGAGRLATAYTDTLRLLANPALLSAKAAQLPAGPVQLPAGPEQLTAGPDLVQLPVEKEPAVQEDRKQQAARANTIMNYFRPSQSQQSRQDHSRYFTVLYGTSLLVMLVCMCIMS